MTLTAHPDTPAAGNPAKADSAATAYALSNALVAEARAHVDSLLSNEAWLRQNRHVFHPGAEYAFWRIAGNNKLSVAEQHRLRNGYLKDSGWAKVEFVDTDRLPAGEWVLRFYL